MECHLRYGSELWNTLSDAKLDQLRDLQDKAHTLIENVRSSDGWVCNWPPVLNLTKCDKAVVTCRILNNLCPGSLHGKFSMRSQITA